MNVGLGSTFNGDIQNGDETGVDCGGSCAPCSASDVILNEGYFETGWDGWIDGGSDCARRSDATRSFEGNFSIRIRDNSGVASSMTSPTFNLSSFNEVEFDFFFYSFSMENGEDFWLQYNDGSGFVTIASWARGTDFNNNAFGNYTVTLNTSQYKMHARKVKKGLTIK